MQHASHLFLQSSYYFIFYLDSIRFNTTIKANLNHSLMMIPFQFIDFSEQYHINCNTEPFALSTQF